MTLRPYQEAAVEALVSGKAGYLAADAGLGKTRMAMAVARARKARKVLYICPASVKIAVVAELKKWEPHWKFHIPKRPADVGTFKPFDNAPLWTVVNYDKLSKGTAFISALIDQGPFDMMVVDEAHYAKSFGAARTRAVFKDLTPHCAYVLPMSATPMPNHAGELYAPLRYLAPHLIQKPTGGVMRQDEFEDRYCQVSLRHVGRSRPVRTISGSKNMEDLKRRLGGFFLRLRKQDHLKELPPLQFVTEYIGADDLRLDGKIDIPEGMSDDELLAFLNSSEHFASTMRLIGLAKVRPAAEYLEDFLSDNHRKIVVWAKHHEVIDGLMARLAKVRPVKIDGRDSIAQRETAVQQFLGGSVSRAFIGQIQAAGTGLTLLNDAVQPSDVFFLETDAVPGNNYQAACRVHRIGQNNAVLVRTFVAVGVALDQRIQNIVTRKSNEISQLF